MLLRPIFHIETSLEESLALPLRLIRPVERTYQITWVLDYERESKLIGKNLGSKQQRQVRSGRSAYCEIAQSDEPLSPSKSFSRGEEVLGAIRFEP
jgi:hypothetical protein